jgi:putative membrane-bound dehydrogenase-like protein
VKKPLQAARAALIGLVATGASPPAPGYNQVQPPAHVVFPKPMSPAQSLAAIKVPDGLTVELVASEPDTMDPVDLAFGPDGRIWVVEMADYPLGMDGHGKPGGRIRVLESTRGDGRYDKSTLFASGLRMPNTVIPWRKGALVVSVPDILYLEDTKGDGHADRTVKLFTGLTEGNPQHRSNGLKWGLDGWLYMANGNSGGKMRSEITGQELDIGTRDYRINPDDGRIELQTGESQYGRSRDAWGNWFGSQNTHPIWHYALDEHYLRRNPQLLPPKAVVIVPSGPELPEVHAISPTVDRFNDPEGADHFTSACSVMFYGDNVLGAGYAGNAFVCEPVHNLVSRYVLHPSGVTFVGVHPPDGAKAEFLASADNWSRFTAARTGPDGALYVVDMYRLVIEHPEWIPDAWQKLIGNLRAGEFQGRIFRVRPKDAPLRAVPRLDRADARGLVEALQSPNVTVRDLAEEQLMWRADASVAGDLDRLAAQDPQPEVRVQALATLGVLGRADPAVLAKAFADPNPWVRREAVRLSDGLAASDPALLPALARLVDDPDPFVLQQVAYSLGEWRQPEAGHALARLVRQNTDRFVLAAAMSSAVPHAESLIAEIDPLQPNPTLVEMVVSSPGRPALARLLAAVAASTPASGSADPYGPLSTVLGAMARRGLTLDDLGPGNATAVKAVLSRARSVAGDRSMPAQERRSAVAALGYEPDRAEGDGAIMVSCLSPQSPVDLQLAAVRALGHVADPSLPERVLAGWQGYSPAVRTAVLDLLISRAEWALALLDRVAGDKAMLAQIDGARRSGLLHHSSGQVALRAAHVLAAGVDPNRQKVIDRYLQAMDPLQGVRERGRAVFSRVCTVCHRLDGIGTAFGPDLGSLADRSRLYLTTHILDPNRVVEPGYMLYVAVTGDGRSVAGILAEESGESVTVVGLDGSRRVLLRSQLRSLASTGLSPMPDGIEGGVTPQDMADLVAFISSPGGAPGP